MRGCKRKCECFFNGFVYNNFYFNLYSTKMLVVYIWQFRIVTMTTFKDLYLNLINTMRNLSKCSTIWKFFFENNNIVECENYAKYYLFITSGRTVCSLMNQLSSPEWLYYLSSGLLEPLGQST